MGSKLSTSWVAQSNPVQAKVQLVWVKLTTITYYRMSYNILREICAYLDTPQPLLAVQTSSVQMFQYKQREWGILWKLSSQIQISDSSSYVYMGAEKVFVCGGLDINLLASRKTFQIEAGAVEALPEMLSPRFGAGVFHDYIRSQVYVFGGHNKTTPQRSSETYSPRSWSSIGDMPTARSFFNPCAHRSLLYLCGGRTPAIDTYDPSSHQYAAFPPLVLPEVAKFSDCSGIISDNNLIVAVSDCVLTCRLEDGKVSKAYTAGRFHVWSNCPPVVFKGVVYFAGFYSEMKPVCRALDFVQVRWLDEVQFPH